MCIRKQLTSQLKAEDGSRTVVARISTTSVDRDGDVLLPSGVDLTDYRKNPVVLFGHQNNGLPVGHAQIIERESNSLVAKVKFADRPASHPSTAEWVPDTIFELFKQGVLRAFSVGFTVPEGGARMATKRDRSKFGEAVRRIITNWNLLEFSVVPVPANQDALAMAVSKGLLNEQSWTWGELSAWPETYTMNDEPEEVVTAVDRPFRVSPPRPVRIVPRR